MKPISLTIQAFGPYPGTEEINFAKLAEKGIYLIKGPTGSGKTTIFDAMTMALYGKCGDANRNDLEAWRCTQAASDVDTLIAFTFAEHGRTYRFARRLSQKRVNLAKTLEAGVMDENGNYVPFFTNPKLADMAAKAEEIIGLNCEQFTQVVMLPQGKFEEFLVAKSADKEAILSKIFGTDKWSAYVAAFANAAKKRKDELDVLHQAVQNVLDTFGVQNIDGLKEKIKTVTQQQSDLEKAHADFDVEGKKKQLDDDKTLSHEFETLHTLEKERDDLAAQHATIEEKKHVLQKADGAEPFRGLMDAAARDKAETDKRQNTLDTLTKKVPDSAQAVQTANDTLQKHIGASPVDALNKEIGEYETRKTDYANLDELRKALQSAIAVRNTKNTEKTAAENAENKAKGNAQKARETYQAAHVAADRADRAYYDGIYGELAQNLHDGEKCPVCGSVTHPEPAQRSAESVTRDQMLKAKKDAQLAKDAFEAADKLRENATQAVQAAAAALAQAETEKATAQAKYDNAQNNMIAGIADSAALEAAIAEKQKQIKAYQDREKELRVAVQAAENAKSTLDAQVDTAKEEWEKAAQQAKASAIALADALKKAGYPEDGNDVRAMMKPEEERNKLREAIAKYDQSCKDNKNALDAQRKKVIGKTEPDKTLFDAREKEITETQSAYDTKKGNLMSERERLEGTLGDLEPQDKKYRADIAQAESDVAVAKALRGDTGIGLQRYVLAVMFGQVIGEANRMLQKVHGGRYALFRTDEAGSHQKKGGLELRVFDAREPDGGGRSVSSLSGGEKFLVSLALSIGLSSFAQRTGVRIEALFIDEGFGTLDNASIADAMSILDSVRNSGTVGIISHVKLLEENIPTQIEIIKTDNGSHIA